MADLSRRELLVGTALVAVAASLPAAASAAIEAPLPAEIVPAWAVGTPGEFNYQHIIAKTAEEAEKIFRAEWVDESCEDGDDPDVPVPCGECQACTIDLDVTRVKAWDGKKDVFSVDWLDAGMGTYCERCSYECFRENGAQNVNGEAVCEDCMKLADWEIVDPDYAAELREEASYALSSKD